MDAYRVLRADQRPLALAPRCLACKCPRQRQRPEALAGRRRRVERDRTRSNEMDIWGTPQHSLWVPTQVFDLSSCSRFRMNNDEYSSQVSGVQAVAGFKQAYRRLWSSVNEFTRVFRDLRDMRHGDVSHVFGVEVDAAATRCTHDFTRQSWFLVCGCGYPRTRPWAPATRRGAA